MVVLALRTPGFEIQEQPGQSRIVEGMTIIIIQETFRLGAFGQQQAMRFQFKVEVAHALAPDFLDDAAAIHKMLCRDQMAVHFHRVIRADAQITRRHTGGECAVFDPGEGKGKPAHPAGNGTP